MVRRSPSAKRKSNMKEVEESPLTKSSSHEEEDANDDDTEDKEDEEEEQPSAPNTPNNSGPPHPHLPVRIPIQPYYPYPYPYPGMPHGFPVSGGDFYSDASGMMDPPPDTRRNRGGVTEPFPEKLHRCLDTCERDGRGDVFSFFSHGRAFAIHKPRRFVADIMPRFFRQTKLTSFQRQLNLYGFKRISQGPDSGGYYHELFLKGRLGLCVNMKRTKIKGSARVKRELEGEQPNFYAMHPVMRAPHGSAATSPVPVLYPPGYAPYYPGYGFPPAPPYTAAQAPGATPQQNPPPMYPYPYPPFYGWMPPQHGSPTRSSAPTTPGAASTPGGVDVSPIKTDALRTQDV